LGRCTDYAPSSPGAHPFEPIDELTATPFPSLPRGGLCVVLAADASDPRLPRCLQSLRDHTPAETPLLTVPADTSEVNRALARFAPADVVLLSAPCLLTPGWLARLRDAALSDTSFASASCLADSGTPLALAGAGAPLAHGGADLSVEDLPRLAALLAEHSLALRPRLARIVGPCVYLRRSALELVGPFDERIALRAALEVDFARRCLLAGLSHVAADDVLVGHLASELEEDAAVEGPVAASNVLPRALRAARRPFADLSVTIDARALGPAVTGTQRHIFELIAALAATRRLRLRLVVGPDCDPSTVDLLRSLPLTELLPIGEIGADTPRTTIFHRPHQAFEPADMRLALRLGERIVLSQLDLIAYRNPGYHADAAAWRSHRRAARQALAAADRVVVSSPHTRFELLSDELLDEDRVRIVPPGLDHGSPPEPTAAAESGVDVLLPDAGPDGFLLCLGTDFTHKNRLFALRLLSALREHHVWRGLLVFAGTHIPYGSSRESERDFLERFPELRAAVVDLGSVAEPVRERLARDAAAVLYPSVYEGFGLIPFEAALAGTPCAFAPATSLADVLPAEAAVLLPWDDRESAARLYGLLRDPAARRRHLDAIVEASRKFTWAQAAAAMAEVYEEAALAPAREAAALGRDELRREQELRDLIAAHDALVVRLVAEREHARRMYDDLNAEVGSGLSLIGPHGALPDELQRALLALSARPALSRPLFGLLARVFRLMRMLAGGRSPRG
jgi:glycosyltransferase involved in cell wall biosynthesis